MWHTGQEPNDKEPTTVSTPLSGIPGFTIPRPAEGTYLVEEGFEEIPDSVDHLIPTTTTVHDEVQAGTAPAESYADWIKLAETTIGQRRNATSLRASLRERDALMARLAVVREQAKVYPHNLDYIPGMEIKINTVVSKIRDLVSSIGFKASEQSDPENRIYLDQASALIEVVKNSSVDANPTDMLLHALPEYSEHFRSRGLFYREIEPGKIERVDDEELTEQMNAAMKDRQFARIVGTAIRLSEMGDTPLDVGPVLKNWFYHLRNYTDLLKWLPTRETMKISDWWLPIVADGQEMVLNRKTGTLHEGPDDGSVVLYPPVTLTSKGESRALDAMIYHHFSTQEEIDAFYLTCGISLFGYGVPNLVFLLGRGGSGKDALFSLMRAVHGEKQVVTLNALALMGHDEANDLVRLQSARMALCSFESSHHSDGSFKPAVLKSITSGGQNPLTARAKYAKAAVDIYFRGSLWLYGNRVPNLTGGGDFDGLDRRFMIMPMTKKLPEVAPPTGFTTWSEAITACAPVFAYRCMIMFMEWFQQGQRGFSDVRRRIPREWRELSNEHLVGSSRFGFLRDVFMPDPNGLSMTAVLEVMGAIMKQEGIRIGRSRYLDVLKDTISTNARFEDMKHLEPDRRGNLDYLPITVVPSNLRKLLDSENLTTALMALNRPDVGWEPEIAENAYKFNREAQLRAKLYGDDREEMEGEQ